jgi:pimeloyl-ACP methyl ester carboxylesterase
MELTVRAPGGVALASERDGAGPLVVLLHGLTATRRYVVMGSTALQRLGHQVIAYDARGHGHSDPAPTRDAYTYPQLVGDLIAVLDSMGAERAVLAGASMGAHTAVSFALSHPERVAALALITPAYDPDAPIEGDALVRWDALARGLRDGGVEGFMSVFDTSRIPDAWRTTVERAVRQRLGEHEHPQAVADALEVVPRSRPFEHFTDLRAIAVPTSIIASRDQADPEHPLAVAERYAELIPGARLVVEDEPPPLRSPIAWQGGRVAQVIAELVSRTHP